ncbi:MAG TPA: zinc-ribbon domain-containing protein, partial [Polaromonas sp.]
MSLITRCPACGTMFKVVTDQLKVSQGWVRCGQCAEVFDASMNLLPGETASLPPSAFVADEVPVAPQALPQSRNVQEPEALPPLPNPNAPAEPEWAPARLFADRVPLVPLA